MDNIIIDKYKNGIGATTIARELGIKESKIYRILNRNKIKRRNAKESHAIIGLMDNVFETIDSEVKAYTLGFIAADGCILKPKRSSTILKIDIKKDDGLVLFPRFYDLFNLPYDRTKFYTNKTTYGSCEIARLRIPSDKICKDLSKYGIVENKTFKLTMPNIQEEFKRHFIRGYFDGDGCITTHGVGTYIVKIIGTEDLMKDILLEIEKNTGISSKRKLFIRHKERASNIKSFEIGGRRQIIKIRDYFYKDATIYLTRKRRIFDEV